MGGLSKRKWVVARAFARAGPCTAKVVEKMLEHLMSPESVRGHTIALRREGRLISRGRGRNRSGGSAEVLEYVKRGENHGG